MVGARRRQRSRKDRPKFGAFANEPVQFSAGSEFRITRQPEPVFRFVGFIDDHAESRDEFRA
jgi:hypothetical protein